MREGRTREQALGVVKMPGGHERRTRVHRRIGGTAYTTFGTFAMDTAGVYRWSSDMEFVLEIGTATDGTRGGAGPSGKAEHG